MLRCQPRDPVLNCEAFVRVFVCSCVLHRLCRHDPDTGPVDTSLLHGVPVLRGEADCPADQDGFPGTDRQAEGDEGVETEPGRARGTDRSKAMVWIQASKQGRGEERRARLHGREAGRRRGTCKCCRGSRRCVDCSACWLAIALRRVGCCTRGACGAWLRCGARAASGTTGMEAAIRHEASSR